MHISGLPRTENDEEECYALEDPTPIGCMSRMEACEPVVLNMQDPNSDTCYQINGVCTPQGWSSCTDINQMWPECPIDCSSLSVLTCASYPQCSTIDGSTMTLDDANECYMMEPAVAVGCMDGGMICGDAITYAASTEGGECMMFTSTCIPSGWTACNEWDSYQECPPD